MRESAHNDRSSRQRIRAHEVNAWSISRIEVTSYLTHQPFILQCYLLWNHVDALRTEPFVSVDVLQCGARDTC
jgi:hypothetical protein